MNGEDWCDYRVLDRTTRTAKQPHVCMCGKTIVPGERYHREFGLIDGDPTVTKLSAQHIHRGEAS